VNPQHKDVRNIWNNACFPLALALCSCFFGNWIGAITILVFLRNSITISLIVSVSLQLHWSLKNTIMYTCRDLWPTCRCIQLVRTFVWTLLPQASPYMRPFDWIESIHPFPTASSLSRSNPSSSAAEATATDGGGDYCSRQRRPRSMVVDWRSWCKLEYYGGRVLHGGRGAW